MNLADRLAAVHHLCNSPRHAELLTEAATAVASVIATCRLRDNSGSNCGAHQLARGAGIVGGLYRGE